MAWMNLEDILLNEIVTKRQILPDSAYRRWLEQSKSWKQNVEEPGAGVRQRRGAVT